MINDNLFIANKRIYLKTNEYGPIDATTYVLGLVQGWFIENDYHVTKETNPKKGIHALMYSNDEEIVQQVQNFYNIQENDFTPTRKQEELPYIEHLKPKE